MKDFNIVAYGSDSYKLSHHGFYPKGLQVVQSYCESRPGGMFDEIVFFGLQYILKEYLCGQVVTKEKIDEAEELANAHLGPYIFNRAGWEYILKKHNGYLPIEIWGVSEGTVHPPGTPLFTIQNTDENVPWLTNYLETMLMQVWSPTTVATGSREVKKIIDRYLEKTGDPSTIDFKLHDFGFRGTSSPETAALAGAAHLVNFQGTDTMAALALLRDYYTPHSEFNNTHTISGFSIPATEHSVMTMGGPDGEREIVNRILDAHPTGLVACVIDSYDTIRFIKEVIGGDPTLVKEILDRDGTLVFRPDSGDLPMIDLDVFWALEEVFGTTVNEKGYKVLPLQVRMIQGDGIKWTKMPTMSNYNNHESTVELILQAFKDNMISADNIAFGSGGGLLQQWDRDSLRFAIKCCTAKIDGEWHDIFKKPATDPSKNSKRGFIRPDNFGLIYKDGLLIYQQSLIGIRKRASL